MPLDFLERKFCPVCDFGNFKIFCKLPSYSLMRCQKCSLWLLNPYIGKEGMKRIVSEPEKLRKEYPMVYKYYESEVEKSVMDELLKNNELDLKLYFLINKELDSRISKISDFKHKLSDFQSRCDRTNSVLSNFSNLRIK